jgi:NTP pyrophosphatase (non-canonical NTP hydrolase)
MNSTEYFAKTLVLSAPREDGLSPEQARMMLYGIGTASEGGEVADAVKKKIYHGKADMEEKILEECGDVLWYMVRLLQMQGKTLEDAMQANLDKLTKRWPNGFKRDDEVKPDVSPRFDVV